MRSSFIFSIFVLLFLVQCKTAQTESKMANPTTNSTQAGSESSNLTPDQKRIQQIKGLALTLSDQLQAQQNPTPESQDLANMASAVAKFSDDDLKIYLDSGVLQVLSDQLDAQKAKNTNEQGLQLADQNSTDAKQSNFFKDNQVQLSGLFLFSMGLINLGLGVGRYRALQTPSYVGIIFGMTRVMLSLPLLADPTGDHREESSLAKTIGLAGATFGIINGVLDLAQAGLSTLVQKNVSNEKFMGFVEKYTAVLPTELSAANIKNLPSAMLAQSKISTTGILDQVGTSKDPKTTFKQFEKVTRERANVCRKLGQDVTADTIEHMLEQRRKMYMEEFDPKGVKRTTRLPPDFQVSQLRASYGFEEPRTSIKAKLIWSVINVGTGMFGIISANTAFKLADSSQPPQTPEETMVRLNQVLADYAKYKSTPSLEQAILK